MAAAATIDAGPLKRSIISYECHLESLDDWTAAQLPSSPSGIALRAVRESRIHLSHVSRLGGQKKRKS